MMNSANPSAPIHAAQRRALFAAARARGMSTDDLRAMTPAGSISMLTADQAHCLLDRLNGNSPFAIRHSSFGGRRRRRPRAAAGVIRMVSPEQRALIISIRMELGWTDAELHDWLMKRHHADGRPMNVMQSSADAVAVIELLKGVRTRTFIARWRKKNNNASLVRCRVGDQCVVAVPPIDQRQIWTIRDRLARIARARGQSSKQAPEWAYTLRLRNGRLARGIADSAEASELIELLTKELSSIRRQEAAP